MPSRWHRSGPTIAAFVMGVLVTTLAVGLAQVGDDRPDGSTAEPAAPAASPPPGTIDLSGNQGARTVSGNRVVGEPRLMPYPFMSPTPAPQASAIDGTYLRTMTLQDVGGARIGLPYRCFRCPPFRIDAGVSTLVFFEGAYYLNHQLSGFRTLGSFVVEGDRITLFNDANCPQTPGVYEFEVTSHGLRFTVVEDDCPFDGERADDLMVRSWTRVPACIRRLRGLWPGEIAC